MGMGRINKDVGAGLLFIAFGAFFAVYAATTLRFGTAFRMGPGFFPVVVGGLLALFGTAILLRGIASTAGGFGTVPWRAVVVIPLSLIAFGILTRPLGLLIALLVMSFAAAFASRRMTAGYAALMSVVITAFCIILFTYVLDLSLPLLGTLLE